MIRSMSDVNIKQGLKTVLQQIEASCSKRSAEFSDLKPRLVAVSKVKPVELIIEAYEEGQRHFGENYVQELQEKSMHRLILEKCPDIKWHFIGHLQANKINKVLSVPNLYIIETVHSRKLASQLNKNWPNFGPSDSKLKIMVQVNTSGEKEKSGISVSEVTEITDYVLKECHNLRFEGLMTIGEYGYDYSKGPNPDFLCLIKCRDEVCKKLSLDWKKVELSMGMSNDFDRAIEMGSTNVRVGQMIFGERQYKN
ncbi:pyridoxal phosphate homeostasis protein [Euwallacea fornicatus]|uniref:pyridoxal phosphate homeostasis protein n=1 Tax=Euwallacea fornicatus TaxID=995702 RepID=UPI00338D6C42